MKRLFIFAVISYWASVLLAQIPIIGWWGVPEKQTSVSRYKEMRDCGFDMSLSVFYSVSALESALQAAHKAGVKLIPCCPSVERGDMSANLTKLRSYPAFFSYCLGDEPTMKQMKSYKDRLAAIRKLDKDFPCYVNLAPSYGPETLDWLGVSSYREYISSATKQLPLEQISFDYYPIISTTFKEKVRSSWYSNLEIIRKASISTGTPFWGFVLVTSHAVYPKPTLASLRLQIYSNLAYGAKAITYFTYWTPANVDKYDYHDGPITDDGKQTSTYKLVKKMNAELRGFSSLFSDGRVTSVDHIGKVSDETKNLKEYPLPLRNVRVLAPEGAIVSFLEVDGAKYIVWVNKSLTQQMEINNLPFTNKSLFRINKKMETERLKNKYVLNGGDILIVKYQ